MFSTRMHSSMMRTVRCSDPPGGCIPACTGQRGVCVSQHALGRGRMTDRCLWKYYLAVTSLWMVITGRNEVVAKVMFLLKSVILSTGRVSGRENPPWQGDPPGKEAPWQGITPPGRETPLARRLPQQGEPPGQGDPPGYRDPPGKENPLAGRPPWQGEPPSREIPWQGDPPSRRPPQQGDPPVIRSMSIRSMSDRYASYWNAFLLLVACKLHKKSILESRGMLHRPVHLLVVLKLDWWKRLRTLLVLRRPGKAYVELKTA